MRLTLSAGLIALLSLGLPGCGGDDDQGDRLAGVVSGPPANLIEECKKVARQTKLTVYCPPVAPEGPVQIQANGTWGEKFSYGLSLRSESLAHSERAFAQRPEEGHWAVVAIRPARLVGKNVDLRVRYPHAGRHFGQQRHFITVNGVRATVLTGKTTGAGLVSSDHVIIYWRIGDTGYLASVHDRFPGRASDQSRRYAPVAAEIAKGLIRQMVE
ncbi:MAG: hypothetical protein AABM42_12750 [Actinomycetota bacterium]